MEINFEIDIFDILGTKYRDIEYRCCTKTKSIETKNTIFI